MENQDWKLGLREETIPVFEAVSRMDVVKGLYLCGGTAQSLQMMHRKFRDYYDIYALLKEGYDLAKGVDYAGRFSRHTIHSKFIYSILLNDSYFHKPAEFALFEPKYEVSTNDIAEFVRLYIEEKEIKIKK